MDAAVAPPRERRLIAASVVALLGVAIYFRLLHLGSLPGIDGDEGWWGVQALRWLHEQAYETHTTNGNPIDVFLLVPLGLAHALWKPSFTLLRAVPAVLNVLALPIGFLLVRRLYGSTAAWTQTIATAVLPTAIAHSRICQDPSQSIPWTGLVVWLSLLGLKERPRAWLYAAAALAAFFVAVRTHPTNVFVLPFVALPFAAAVASVTPGSRRGRILVGVVALAGVAVIAAIVLPWVVHLARSNELLDKPWLSIAAARLVRPAGWLEFMVNYGRLFDGVVVYHYLVDPHLVSIPSDAGFALAAPLVAWGMVIALTRDRSIVDGGLVAAWAAMALLFFAFAGPDALRPHAERWGLCLIPPGIMIVARSLDAWIRAWPRRRTFAIGLAGTAAAGLLGAFYLDFFRPLETYGGRSHITFVTARIEPKQQAFDVILARRAATEPILIVGQLWWQFYPIAYLAQQQPNVTVTMTIPADDRPELRDALERGHLFFVEFAGTRELARARSWIASRGRTAATTVITDAGGRELLDVMEAVPPGR